MRKPLTWEEKLDIEAFIQRLDKVIKYKLSKESKSKR